MEQPQAVVSCFNPTPPTLRLLTPLQKHFNFLRVQWKKKRLLLSKPKLQPESHNAKSQQTAIPKDPNGSDSSGKLARSPERDAVPALLAHRPTEVHTPHLSRSRSSLEVRIRPPFSLESILVEPCAKKGNRALLGDLALVYLAKGVCLGGAVQKGYRASAPRKANYTWLSYETVGGCEIHLAPFRNPGV